MDGQKYYMQDEVKKALVRFSKNREMSPRYGEGFGKRPDTLEYESDVEYLVKKGATSFHVSEEIWENPLAIRTGMKKSDLDAIRIGWDLILDVDCKIWEYSKLITHLLIEEIKKFNLKSISCKFSGNKGFHIAVPWECMPPAFGRSYSQKLFPELPRQVLQYLVDQINPKLTNLIVNSEEKLNKLATDLEMKKKEMYTENCKHCGNLKKEKTSKATISCPNCSTVNEITQNKGFINCTSCNDIIEVDEKPVTFCAFCDKELKTETKFDIDLILDVDAILVAPRHLYRMPYSLHEKSGLVSVPLDADKVLKFDKEDAKPENVVVDKFPFLHHIEGDSAAHLCKVAHEYVYELETKTKKEQEKVREKRIAQNKDRPKKALPIEDFPPCINAIREGMVDGRKRAMFCYVGFLFNVGWSYDEVEKELLEWNKKNGEEPLRENILLGHLATYKRSARRQEIMPPNCDNKSYYVDLNFCHPDGYCKKIKNPVQYTTRKEWIREQKEKQSITDKLNDDQKQRRQDFRSFDTWFGRMKEFVEKNEKLPENEAKTKKEQELFDWMTRFQERFKKEELNNEKVINDLRSLNILQ